MADEQVTAKAAVQQLKRCFSPPNRRWLVQIIQSSLILLPYSYIVFLSCWFCFCCSDFSGLLPHHVARPVLCLYAIFSISSLYFFFTVFVRFLVSHAQTVVRFCNALPFAPVKFFACLCFALISKFYYALFASQTSGLCSAFPSLPANFLLACILFYSEDFVARALPYKHRV